MDEEKQEKAFARNLTKLVTNHEYISRKLGQLISLGFAAIIIGTPYAFYTSMKDINRPIERQYSTSANKIEIKH